MHFIDTLMSFWTTPETALDQHTSSPHPSSSHPSHPSSSSSSFNTSNPSNTSSSSSSTFYIASSSSALSTSSSSSSSYLSSHSSLHPPTTKPSSSSSSLLPNSSSSSSNPPLPPLPSSTSSSLPSSSSPHPFSSSSSSPIPVPASSASASSPSPSSFSSSPSRKDRETPWKKLPLVRKRHVEQVAVVDPETFEASLEILPFTLKNMALRYVPDLKWNLTFGGVNWQFYVHVLSSDQRLSDNFLIGLKVVGDDVISGSGSGSGSGVSSPKHSGEEISCHPHHQHLQHHSPSPSTAAGASWASLAAASALQVAAPGSPGSLGSQFGSSADFVVAWKVCSPGNDSPVAVCPPSVHRIEPDDDYVVEFTDEEFNIASSMDVGLVLHVTIKLLKGSPNPSEDEKGAMEEEDEFDEFFDNEEDELAHMAARQRDLENPRTSMVAPVATQ